MQPQNTQTFTEQNKNSFPNLFFKWRVLIAIVFAITILLLSGCKKILESTGVSNALLQQYFEKNILNNDFIVSLATDNGTDITAQYNGYVFRLTKNTLLDGPITGTYNGTTVYTGTWSCNDDYSKLDININQPSVPAGFVFLNRAWRFTKKDLPTMQLAPWGTTDAKVLHMTQQ
jgi:uncharacterized membrane protein